MTKIIDTLALSGFWAGVKTRLNNKADASHSHVIADVTSLQTLLDGKANSVHTHTIADVTGLQTALNGKSDTGHTHSLATITTAGYMSGADKSKLDGVASGANNYSLPTASASTLGGVKVGSNLTITDGVLSATDTNTTYSAATTSTSGLMTPTDKVKLDGVAPNANNYAHPANHPPSIITQDANNRFVTDAEKSTWSDQASTVVQLAESVAALQKSAQPATHYVNTYTPIGVFVKTDLTVDQMAYIEINANTYNSSDQLQRYVLQFYTWVGLYWSAEKLIALDGSKPMVASLYLIDNKVCFWIPSGIPWATYYITAYRDENPARNLVTSITNEEKPTVYQSTIDVSSVDPRPKATASSDGLYPKEHFAKVDAIPASPKYTDTVTTVNGKTGAITKSDITALGIPAQDTVYTHPSTHPASIITQDPSRRMVSDAQISAWDSKASGNHTHDYSPTGHTHDSVQTAQNTALKFSRLTQAQYDALGTKDPNTLYIIVG